MPQNQRLVLPFLFLSLQGLVACTTRPTITEEEFPHMVAIAKDGSSAFRLRTEAGTVQSDPDFKAQLQAVRAKLKDHLDDEPESIKHVLLYFHGGMNGIPKGLQNGRDLLERLQDDKNNPAPPPDYHPILVNWDSGPLTSWGFGLRATVQGRVNYVPALLSSPFRLLASAGRAVARTPETLLWQARQNLDELFRGVPILAVPEVWKGPTRMADDQPAPHFWNKWIRPLAPGALRVITTPFADGWGVTAYSDMRRTLHQAFVHDTPATFADTERDNPMAPSDFSKGVLASIADELSRDPAGSRIRVTVAAHSMGAHIANELLQRYPDLPVDKVIFLAPACSIREFRSHTLEFIRHSLEYNKTDPKHPVTEFYCLTLHPDRERSETYVGGVAPHGSLLVYIDDYLTDHHSVENFTLGAWNNAMRALPTMGIEEELAQLVHFKMLNWSEAASHGAVDDLRFWRPEVHDPEAGVETAP